MITEWFRYGLQWQDFMKQVYLSKWEYITQAEGGFYGCKLAALMDIK